MLNKYVENTKQQQKQQQETRCTIAPVRAIKVYGEWMYISSDS
jgi:phosphodiesterase/alkaline phosphatase D-like protein